MHLVTVCLLGLASAQAQRDAHVSVNGPRQSHTDQSFIHETKGVDNRLYERDTGTKETTKLFHPDGKSPAMIHYFSSRNRGSRRLGKGETSDTKKSKGSLYSSSQKKSKSRKSAKAKATKGPGDSTHSNAPTPHRPRTENSRRDVDEDTYYEKYYRTPSPTEAPTQSASPTTNSSATDEDETVSVGNVTTKLIFTPSRLRANTPFINQTTSSPTFVPTYVENTTAAAEALEDFEELLQIQEQQTSDTSGGGVSSFSKDGVVLLTVGLVAWCFIGSF